MLILKGSEIGSGAIIGGNPCRVLREDVFFLRDCVHNYLVEDTYKTIKYDSDTYI